MQLTGFFVFYYIFIYKISSKNTKSLVAVSAKTERASETKTDGFSRGSGKNDPPVIYGSL